MPTKDGIAIRYVRSYDIKPDLATTAVESRVCDVCGELVWTTGRGNFMIAVRHASCVIGDTRAMEACPDPALFEAPRGTQEISGHVWAYRIAADNFRCLGCGLVVTDPDPATTQRRRAIKQRHAPQADATGTP